MNLPTTSILLNKQIDTFLFPNSKHIFTKNKKKTGSEDTD